MVILLSIFYLFLHLLANILSIISPDIVANVVAIIQGNTMLVGEELLYIILSDIIVVGIIVTPLVFITRKVIILLVAVSFFLFKLCNDFIAF